MRIRNILRSVAFFSVGGVIIPLFLFSCSCAKSAQNNSKSESFTQTKENVSEKSETILGYERTHDSIYVHDSVFLTHIGDTIVLNKWRTKYRDKIVTRCRNDTIIVTKFDTDTIVKVSSENRQTVKEDKKLGIWSWIKQTLGGAAIITIIIFLVVVYLRGRF